MGCYGDRGAETPNIDALSRSGTRFERCYVANPICMPNRFSLFTGLYPRNHGLWTNGLLLDREEPTLPGYLADCGYQTANFGKIHFTPYNGIGGNIESAEFWKTRGDAAWRGPYWGFQHVELTIGHTSSLAHYGYWFRSRGGTDDMLCLHPLSRAMQSGVRRMPPELHDSTFVADRVCDFLKTKRDSDRPFFVVASFPDPHHPFDPPESIAKKYLSRRPRLPIGGPEDLETRPSHYRQHFDGAWQRWGAVDAKHPGGLSREHTEEITSLTHGMVDLIDASVGRILQALSDEGLDEDTIVVFTSDHGELLGDHGLWLKGPFFYEGLVNVPLIIRCPTASSRAVSNQLVSTIDIYPTICDLLGLPIPQAVLGVSAVPQLELGVSTRDHCLIEYRTGYGPADLSSSVLVDDRYKIVAYDTGERELTDLRSDPEERRNLSGDASYANVLSEGTDLLLCELLRTGNRHPPQIGHA
jgi:arylsulfatase A-like enzyme